MALLLLRCLDAPQEIGAPVCDAATGALLCPAYAATEDIALYQGADGKLIREYVSPQSLRDMAALSARKPMTNDHPPEGTWVNADNYDRLQVGETGDDDGFLQVPEDAWGGAVRAKVAIKPTARRADVIADIQAGRKRGISAGYTKQIDNTPGTHPHLGAYDRVRTRVVDVNHFAFCADPRLPGAVLAGFDSAPPSQERPMIPLLNRAARRAYLATDAGKALEARVRSLVRRKGTTDSAGVVLAADDFDYAGYIAMLNTAKDDPVAAMAAVYIANAVLGDEPEEQPAPMDTDPSADPNSPMGKKMGAMDARLKALEAELAKVKPTLDSLDATASQAAQDAARARLAHRRDIARRHGLATASDATEAAIVAHLRAKGIGNATDSDDAVIVRAEERLNAPPSHIAHDAAPTLLRYSEA